MPERVCIDDPGVPLGSYLPLAATIYFTFRCGSGGCDREIRVGVRGAIARFGPDLGVRALARRLRCGGCGERRTQVTVSSDPRAYSVQAQEGALPETLAEWPSDQ